MLKEKVQNLLNAYFDEHPEVFLIHLSVSIDHKIKVVIDGDKGVNLQDCINVSRQVEHNLDRDAEDFSLEVTSPGAAEPMVHHRQYLKNVSRTLAITMDGAEVEGELIEVTETGIVLEWTQREPKPVGKGKTTVLHRKEVAFEDIKEAKVVIKF